MLTGGAGDDMAAGLMCRAGECYAAADAAAAAGGRDEGCAGD